MLGDMNLCTAPSTAGHCWPGLPGTLCCPAGLESGLEGHVHRVHSVRCALSKVSAFETLFGPLVKSRLQEIFCFCGNLPSECFPPTLGRSSGLFIRILKFLNDLNSVPCVLKSWSAKQLNCSAQRKVFWAEMQKNPEFVSGCCCLLVTMLCFSHSAHPLRR